MDVSSDLSKQSRVVVGNGFVPPQTFQRQVHQRMAAKAAKLSSNAGKLRSTVVRENGGGGEVKTASGGGSASLYNICLCPLRHKVTEVCDFCTARWVCVAAHCQTYLHVISYPEPIFLFGGWSGYETMH